MLLGQHADLFSWLLPSWLLSWPLVLPDLAMALPCEIGMPPGTSASADMRGLIMWDVSSELLALPALRRMPFGGRATPMLSPSDLQTT